MDEHTNNSQAELLTKIHNQLVDLTKMIAEVEMSKTSSDLLKNKLRQFMVNSQYADTTGRTGEAGAPRQQKIIAPTNDAIKPGEGRE